MAKYIKKGGHGGHRKGDGRRAGIPNRAKKELRSAARMSGMMPSAIMLENARALYELAAKQKVGSARHLQLLKAATDAAAAAGPYFEYRLATMKIERPPIDLTKLTDAQLAQFIALYDAAAPTAIAGNGAASTSH